MRQIKTHTQRNMDEMALLLENYGSFTAPLGLPHWRYDGTRRNCHILTECGLAKRVSKQDIHVHFSKGSNFERWVEEGKPPVKEFCSRIKKEKKAANPPKLKKKNCIECGCSFETFNYHQKRCKSNCRKEQSEGQAPSNGE